MIAQKKRCVMQCMYIHFHVNPNSTFLGLTLQGGTRQVAIFSGTEFKACKPYTYTNTFWNSVWYIPFFLRRVAYSFQF